MQKHEIVIIRLDAIGDFILWLDSARHLRALFPKQHITLIANRIWAELARELPYFDDILEISPNRYSGRFKLLKSLVADFFHFRRWSANIVINPVNSRSLHSNLIARWIKASSKIAPSGDGKNLEKTINKLTWFSYKSTLKWYSQIIHIEKNKMELIANAQFLSGLSDTTIDPQLPNLSDLLNLDKWKQPVSLPKRYIVVVPGASNTKRAWGVLQFSQTLQSLTHQIAIVICGAQSEKEIAETLTNILKNEGHDVINLGGKTSLMELIAIISQAEHVIGNESAAIHIASALQIPSISILGGGHFGRFLPYLTNSELPEYAPTAVYQPMSCYGCNWHCHLIKPGMLRWPCIDTISTTKVQESSPYINQKKERE